MEIDFDGRLEQFLSQQEPPPDDFFVFTSFLLRNRVTKAYTGAARHLTYTGLDDADPEEQTALLQAFRTSAAEDDTESGLVAAQEESLKIHDASRLALEDDVFQQRQNEVYQQLCAEFNDFWICEETSHKLVNSVKAIEMAFKDMKHIAEAGESKWAVLDSQKRASLGAKASEQVVLEQLESKLEDFMIVNDDLYKELENPAEGTLVLLLTSSLPKLQQLLERVDQACIRLHHSQHPEAASYIQRYDRFRSQFCVSLKSILCRTFERTERYLTNQIQASQAALEASIEKAEYLDRLTRVATSRDAVTASDEAEDSVSDPLGLRATSGETSVNTFVPARWFYIKFRSYGMNILPITRMLADRASITDIPVYREILEQLGGVYGALRIRFLSRSFERQLVYLIQQHSRANDGLDLSCRQASTFWLSIANYEIDIFGAYFGPEAQRYVQTSLITILQSLGDTYAETLRPYVLNCYDFATLKDIHDCLSVDILDVESTPYRMPTNDKSSLNMLKFAPIHRILGDIEESLIFRIENFIAREIKDFQVDRNQEYLNYPALLFEAASMEVRKSIYLPTTTRAVFCLSKMRNVLNSKVLKSVANEVIATTLEKLNEAVEVVDECNGHNVIDARLFGLREAFYLRENLEFYKFDVSGNVQRILSFEKLRTSIQAMFFFLSTSRGPLSHELTRLGRFLSMITPELKDEEFDSKETLSYKIDDWIQDVISYITKACMMPLLDYLSKGGDLATTLQVFWDQFSSILGSYLNSIGLYLLNVPRIITRCPTFDEISDAPPGSQSPQVASELLKSKRVSLTVNKSDLFFEPIRIAIGEAYRQFMKAVNAQGTPPTATFFSVHKVDNLIRFYFKHFESADESRYAENSSNSKQSNAAGSTEDSTPQIEGSST